MVLGLCKILRRWKILVVWVLLPLQTILLLKLYEEENYLSIPDVKADKKENK